MLGRAIGPYVVEELLGEGATAVVYRAHHGLLDRRFALKLFRADVSQQEVAQERFMREAKSLAAIASPHVVRLNDFGVTTDGRPYLVMEWLDGHSLMQHMAPGLELTEVIRLAIEIAQGLEAVHGRQVIHRDLKPANVMVTGEGQAKIVDFGLVCGDPETFPALTAADAILGTPRYMAPEQVARSDLSERTDLYALGVIMYEMITRGPAFQGKTLVEILHNQLTQTPPPLAPAYGGLGQLVDALMDKEPERRPASAVVTIEELKRIRDDLADTEGAVPADLPDTLISPRTWVRTFEGTPIQPKELTPSDHLGGTASDPKAPRHPPPTPPKTRRPVFLWSAAIALVVMLVALLTVRPEQASPPSRNAVKPKTPPVRPEAVARPVVPTPLPSKKSVKQPDPKPRKIRRPVRRVKEPRTPTPPPPPPPAPPELTPKQALYRLKTTMDAGEVSMAQERRYFDLRDDARRARTDAQRKLVTERIEAFRQEIRAGRARPQRQ